MNILWNRIERAFDQLCEALEARKLLPLLEADVVGYFYHLLIALFDGDSKRVHLATRLAGTSGNDKFDLAIGDIQSTEQLKRSLIERAGDRLDDKTRRLVTSKSVRSGFRPAIRGELILEFKHFASGFDPTQLRVHLDQAIEDVKKLGGLRDICPEGRGVVLFDDMSYLTEARQHTIKEARVPDDSSLRIYLFQRDNRGEFRWAVY